MQDRMRIRVSLAVLPIDDFTGKIITAPVLKAAVKGGGKPVRKAEGFFVFTNLTSSIAEITVEGPCYYREERIIDIRQLDPANPVVKIRMLPGRTYALPQKAIRLMVLLPQGSAFSAFYERSTDYKKLLTDYEKDDSQIGLYQTGKEDLEGKGCWIVGRNDQKEFICLGQKTDRERGTYLLSRAAAASYKKIGTRVYPVTKVTAQEERTWFLALKDYGLEEVEYTCILERNGKRTEQKILLKAGTENYLDLQEEGHLDGAAVR